MPGRMRGNAEPNAQFCHGNGRHHGHQRERQSSQKNVMCIKSLEIDFLSEKPESFEASTRITFTRHLDTTNMKPILGAFQCAFWFVPNYYVTHFKGKNPYSVHVKAVWKEKGPGLLSSHELQGSPRYLPEVPFQCLWGQPKRVFLLSLSADFRNQRGEARGLLTKHLRAYD